MYITISLAIAVSENRATDMIQKNSVNSIFQTWNEVLVNK